MGIWIELRCEHRDKEESYGGELGEFHGRCWSHDNTGCGQIALDTVKDVVATKREIEGAAAASGWTRTREGWVCPFCSGNEHQ